MVGSGSEGRVEQQLRGGAGRGGAGDAGGDECSSPPSDEFYREMKRAKLLSRPLLHS